MSRSRAGIGFHNLRLGSQGSLRGVEGIDQQLIQSEVRDNREAIIRGHCDSVGVRSFLTLGIYARAFVLHERGSLSQPAVFQYREHSHAALRVVGNDSVLARPIQSNVSRILTTR